MSQMQDNRFTTSASDVDTKRPIYTSRDIYIHIYIYIYIYVDRWIDR
jgi:hypothetical protein